MSEKDRHGDGALERFARRTFEQSAAGVDAAARSRLTRARFRALEAARSTELERDRRQARIAWAATAATLAVTLAVSFSLRENRPEPAEGPQFAALGDLEILAGAEELELLEEELDFYAWLEQQPELAPEEGRR